MRFARQKESARRALESSPSHRKPPTRFQQSRVPTSKDRLSTEFLGKCGLGAALTSGALMIVVTSAAHGQAAHGDGTVYAAPRIKGTPGAQPVSAQKPAAEVNPPPRARDWARLARLPDWSGVWNPNISDQNAQIKTNPVPWNPESARQVAALVAEEKAGRPKGLFVNCLPEGLPAWLLLTHNALEIIFAPGRVTILGESDGNRLRRIYTDGRSHPEDPDPTFHGHSIGHWEGETLVIDTLGILPQTYLAVSEAVGIPNNGDLHVSERLHLNGKDLLDDEIEITAPHILSAPWRTTRSYFRQRARKYDIVEGVCLQGYFSQRTDRSGNSIFVPIPQTEGGNPVPLETK